MVNATVCNEDGIVDIEGIVNSRDSIGVTISVGEQVGSLTERGPATFKNGTVLRRKPLGEGIQSGKE